MDGGPLRAHVPLLLLLAVGAAVLPAPALAERSFRLFVVDAAIEDMDKAWFGENTWMKMRTVNATMNVGEWDLEVLKELGTDVQSKWNMMEKVDGNYKASSIKGSATVCDDLHSKRPSIKALGYSRSSLPKSCPIKPGLYSLRNHVPNENYFPVIIPGSDWRLANTWSTADGKPIMKFHFDIKIDRTRKLQG